MIALRMVALGIVVAIAQSFASAAVAAGFADVLATPAVMSPLAAKSLMLGVARAGNVLVAVGQRGHIVVSTDFGVTWKQSRAPASSDLTAVFFVNERKGWAVGHDGVVLASIDGGATWSLQLDGNKANELLVAAMERTAAAQPASEAAKGLLAEAKRYKEQGPDKPFLDVWFADENDGFVVGAYNLIFHTADGGKSWEPWFDRTDNPKFFNLYAIRPAAGTLYIAGEGGLVLKYDSTAQRFRALAIPYNGSFFGVTGGPASVLVYGLRGNVFRSDDGGAAWTKVDTGLPATVVASARIAPDTTLLADGGGRVVFSGDGGRSFRKLTLKQTLPLTGLADLGEGRLAITGPRGVAVTETAARQ